LDISPASIILLSAASLFTSEQFARRAGFSGLLQKPYSANELCRVLKSVLPGTND
jgi:CheY-like chemotaxis protein